jgi:hypothetical protein
VAADASVLGALAVPDEHQQQAQTRLDDWLEAGEALHAPKAAFPDCFHSHVENG